MIPAQGRSHHAGTVSAADFNNFPRPKLADHGVGNFSVHALKISVVEMKFMIALGFRLTEIQFRLEKQENRISTTASVGQAAGQPLQKGNKSSNF